MTLAARLLVLSVAFICVFTCIAAAAPQAHPAGEAPAEHGAGAAEHGEKPFLLFGKWELPALLVEIFRWTNFLVVFGALVLLLRQPMRSFFAGRSQAIAEGIEKGRRAAEEAAQRAREIEARLANLEAEIAALRASAATEAQAERDRIIAAARAEAARILATAEQETAALAKSARAELKSYAARLAVELAEQRLRSRLTADRDAALVRGYAAELRRRAEVSSQ